MKSPKALSVAALVAACLLLSGCSTASASPGPSVRIMGEPEIPVTGPLSVAVWGELTSNFAVGIPDASPLSMVTRVEDRGSDTIEVFVDEQLGTAQLKAIGDQVFVWGAPRNTDLATVIVWDDPGKTTAVHREHVPHIKH
ncbi:hypothetical protein HII28_08980 [Planctomonas sp. JC2975]|uniref:hypothetical protein n=1 Tax=Planctomonas sp. JC2975 TaxID=2729626 RepID=UPI001473E2D4|nr:hypothetical protein [Planctomonas sp. JC2975]NNC12013.1 hypothetical protein [Planctomonas sp. JC2975]